MTRNELETAVQSTGTLVDWVSTRLMAHRERKLGLEGWFSAPQLRQIADLMDQYIKEQQDADQERTRNPAQGT